MLRMPLFLALPPRPAGARAALCLGRGRNPLPSASSPRASLFYRRRGLLGKTRRILQSRTGLGRPEAHNPSPLRFREYVVSLSLRTFCVLLRDGAHPFVTDAPAEMPEAKPPDPTPTSCACPRSPREYTSGFFPPMRAQPRREG